MMSAFKILAVIILFTITAFVYYGCGCACETAEQADIPASVIRNANQVIISQTGNDFFNEYVSLDMKRSKVISPDYYLVYRIIMPDKPYVNEVIEFTVDKGGNLNREFSIKGIPDCLNADCHFSVDEEKAISIAEERGLEKGIKEWKTGFTWNEKYNRYVWYVLSTLDESDNTQGGRSSGKEIIIDANTGEVLSVNEWNVR
ncbi:MAG: PepSY domain-containing protein [Ignavibacteriaceae bacterium]